MKVPLKMSDTFFDIDMMQLILAIITIKHTMMKCRTAQNVSIYYLDVHTRRSRKVNMGVYIIGISWISWQ